MQAFYGNGEEVWPHHSSVSKTKSVMLCLGMSHSGISQGTGMSPFLVLPPSCVPPAPAKLCGNFWKLLWNVPKYLRSTTSGQSWHSSLTHDTNGGCLHGCISQPGAVGLAPAFNTLTLLPVFPHCRTSLACRGLVRWRRSTNEAFQPPWQSCLDVSLWWTSFLSKTLLFLF